MEHVLLFSPHTNILHLPLHNLVSTGSTRVVIDSLRLRVVLTKPFVGHLFQNCANHLHLPNNSCRLDSSHVLVREVPKHHIYRQNVAIQYYGPENGPSSSAAQVVGVF